jgi:hydrogenase/urease accessory protein HupE
MADFFFKSWAEFFFFVLMIIGFIVALWATSFSAVISYIVVFLSGMIGGRLIYERKKNLPFPYYIIIIGFLIGYVLGTYYGSRQVIVVLFVLGILFSYHLHNKGYIRDVPY